MPKCLVGDCNKDARSRGYCQTHYIRLHRTGSVELNLPKNYGEKTKHPLYITWVAQKRCKNLCVAWSNDFWKFLEDVSPVPDGHWRLQRKDKSLPYSKENVRWKEVTVSQAKGETVNEYQRRRYHAGLRVETPDQRRGYNLKTNHGLTVEQYQEMFESQNGVCAICGKPESAAQNGKIRPLAVDHCHKTRNSGNGKGIRALLCQACNVGLGKFNDDPELIVKAVEYLRKHQSISTL